MIERRRHLRFSVTVLDIKGKTLISNNVQVIDISTGGLSFKTYRNLQTGRTYHMRIEDGGTVLPLKGTVAWSALTGSAKTSTGKTVPVFKVGLKFVDVTKDKMDTILHFIEKHLPDDSDKETIPLSGSRLSVRFKIACPEKAVIYSQEGFKIKNISLSGMMIESETSMDIGRKLSMEIFRSENKSIKCLGRIVTSEPGKEGERHYYNIGVEFIDMPDKDREMLREIICLAESFGFAMG